MLALKLVIFDSIIFNLFLNNGSAAHSVLNILPEKIENAFMIHMSTEELPL